MFPSVTGPKTDPTVPKWLDRLLNDCTRKLWLLENALAWQNRCKISSIRLSVHLPSISKVQNRTTEIQVTWTSDDIHLYGDSSTLLKSRLEYLMHLSFSWPTHKFYSCTFEHFLHREKCVTSLWMQMQDRDSLYWIICQWSLPFSHLWKRLTDDCFSSLKDAQNTE